MRSNYAIKFEDELKFEIHSITLFNKHTVKCQSLHFIIKSEISGIYYVQN